MKRVLTTLLWLSWTILAQDQNGLPNGPGKETFERVCSKCHDLEGVSKSKNSKEGWTKIVDEMVSRGAEASDQELEQIVNYLATNFGSKIAPKVNVNKASASDLVSALAISSEAAAAIVEYREKNGAFKAWQDLAKVPGVDLKQIADKKDRVEFGEK